MRPAGPGRLGMGCETQSFSKSSTVQFRARATSSATLRGGSPGSDSSGAHRFNAAIVWPHPACSPAFCNVSFSFSRRRVIFCGSSGMAVVYRATRQRRDAEGGRIAFVRHRLFTIAAAISLALCLTTAVLWAATKEEQWTIARHDGPLRSYQLASGATRFIFQITPRAPFRSLPNFRLRSRLGCMLLTGSDGRQMGVTLFVPQVLAQAVFMILPIAWVIALWRRERREGQRRRAGACLRCGYDLRGSAGRCPECGAATAQAGAAHA